jgi:hypothetical protein
MAKLSSDRLKAAIASYWRYVRRCPLVALEANCRLQSYSGELADVLAVNESRRLIETEIKLDIGDFRRDREKAKHRLYARRDELVPVSYFYFAVPKEIANQVGLLCGNLYPYAGVLGTNGELTDDGRAGYDVYVYKEPKLISGRKLSLLELARMAKEQSGTLCRLALKVSER